MAKDHDEFGFDEQHGQEEHHGHEGRDDHDHGFDEEIDHGEHAGTDDIDDGDDLLPEHEALLAANDYKKPLYKRIWFIATCVIILFFVGAYVYFAVIATPKKKNEGFDQASFGVQQETPQPEVAPQSAPPPPQPEQAAMPPAASQPAVPVATPPAITPQPGTQVRPPADPAANPVPDTAQTKTEMGKLYEMMEQQMKHTDDLNRRVRALESRRSSSSERHAPAPVASVGKTTTQKEAKEAQETTPVTDNKPRGRSVSFELTQYQLRSVRPGQAWVQTKDGLKIYNEGEFLPGNERVVKIDPVEMKVETDKGFIRFR